MEDGKRACEREGWGVLSFMRCVNVNGLRLDRGLFCWRMGGGGLVKNFGVWETLSIYP
jgi:hypothetical protein